MAFGDQVHFRKGVGGHQQVSWLYLTAVHCSRGTVASLCLRCSTNYRATSFNIAPRTEPSVSETDAGYSVLFLSLSKNDEEIKRFDG